MKMTALSTKPLITSRIGSSGPSGMAWSRPMTPAMAWAADFAPKLQKP